MNEHNFQIASHQSLPEGFLEPHLAPVDDMLRQLSAADSQVPAELSARVFAASAPLLPSQKVPQPLVWPLRKRRVAWHRLEWGRLAMAASLLIVAVVAVSFMVRSHDLNQNRFAHSNGRSSASLAASINFEPAGSTGELERRIAHLHETQSVTSDEVHDDIANLVAFLEM